MLFTKGLSMVVICLVFNTSFIRLLELPGMFWFVSVRLSRLLFSFEKTENKLAIKLASGPRSFTFSFKNVSACIGNFTKNVSSYFQNVEMRLRQEFCMSLTYWLDKMQKTSVSQNTNTRSTALKNQQNGSILGKLQSSKTLCW